MTAPPHTSCRSERMLADEQIDGAPLQDGSAFEPGVEVRLVWPELCLRTRPQGKLA